MTKQRILIVDDEKGIRESLTIILEMEGFEVSSAEDSSRALNILNQNGGFDYIISDIRLPGANGIELLREIRQKGNTSVVIMISRSS